MAETTLEERELRQRLEALTEEVAALRERLEGPREEPCCPEAERIRSLLEGMGRRVADLWNRGVDRVVEPGREAVSRVESTLGEAPLATAALAFGAGLLLGALLRRRL